MVKVEKTSQRINFRLHTRIRCKSERERTREKLKLWIVVFFGTIRHE